MKAPSTAGTRRIPAWLVVACLVVGVTGLVVGAVGSWIEPPPETGRWETLWSLSWLGMPLVGALVCLRRPTNRVGWSLLAVGTGIGAGLGSYVALLLAGGAAPASVRAVLVVGQAAGFTVGFGSIILVLLHFPTGRVTTRLLQWLPPTVVGLITVVIASTVLRPVADPTLADVTNPLAMPSLDGVLETATSIAAWLLAAAGVVTLGFTVVRSRRAMGVERLQRRWFTLSAAVGAGLFATGVLVDAVVSPEASNPFIYGGFLVGLSGSAAAIGVAILRYRLYEIDRIISRTATYAVVTAVSIGVYAAVAVVPAAVLGLETDLLVAAATLAVAAAFGPVRRRVQGWVDRRFDRARYDAEQVMAGFGERLRNELDLVDLRADLVAVVGHTMQPASVSIWTPELWQ